MTARLLAGGLALLALAGCGGGGGEEAPAASALQAVSRPPSPREAAKLVSRSLWAVVPTAPKKKQDVRPELIRGSAVAVADDTLLASCRVLGKRKQVGLIRHNKYRLAQLAAADPRREVCVLRMPDGPLNVAAGYRDPADLRLGEPIYALVNRTAADVALAQGQVTELPVGPAAPRLRTSLVLPAGVQSGVLIDGYGNLVGVAGPQPGTAGGMMAAAVTGRLAPRLASFEAPAPTVPVPAPRVQPAAFPAPQPVLVMRLDDDEDTERQSVRAAAPAVAAAPAAEADSTTDSPERSSASGGSRNGGRGEAGRGGKGGQSGNGNGSGGRGGQGSGGGTAGGGTGGDRHPAPARAAPTQAAPIRVAPIQVAPGGPERMVVSTMAERRRTTAPPRATGTGHGHGRHPGHRHGQHAGHGQHGRVRLRQCRRCGRECRAALAAERGDGCRPCADRPQRSGDGGRRRRQRQHRKGQWRQGGQKRLRRQRRQGWREQWQGRRQWRQGWGERRRQGQWRWRRRQG